MSQMTLWAVTYLLVPFVVGVASTKAAPVLSARRLRRVLWPAPQRRFLQFVAAPAYAAVFLMARVAGLFAVLSGGEFLRPLLSPWPWLIVIGVLAAAITLLATSSTEKKKQQARMLWLGIGALALVGALLPFANQTIDKAVAQRRLDAAVSETEAGHYSAARAEFEGMLASDFMPPELRGRAEGRKAQVAYEEKRYAEAADLYAEILEKYPRAAFAENIRVSLWWSLHKLGSNEPFGKAFTEFEKLSAKHPQIPRDPVYLVIEPSLVSKIRSDPGSPKLRDKEFLSKKEQELLRFLVTTCRSQPEYRESVALGQFLLGEYTSAYSTSRDKELRSWSLYQQGEMAFARRDFQAARVAYRRISDLNPAYSDRALYRLGRIAELQGDAGEAVEQYAVALSVPGGAIQNVVQRRLCYLVERADRTLVDRLLVRTGPAPGVLREAVFRKLLATSRFDEAVRFAESVDDSYQSIPKQDLAEAKRIASAQRRGTAEDVAFIGQAFAKNASLTYNRAWKGERAQYVYDRDPARGTTPTEFSETVRDYRESTPDQYYLEQNHWVQASAYLERSLALEWRAGPAMTLLDSYVHLAQPSSFVPSDTVRAQYRAKAIALSAEIQKRPGVEETKRAEAQALLASLGLAGRPDVTALAFAIENYGLLAQRYPKDHLANNSLMWVGVACEQVAELREKGTPDYLDAYGQAGRAYEKILADYPSGHVGREAKKRLENVQSITSAWQ